MPVVLKTLLQMAGKIFLTTGRLLSHFIPSIKLIRSIQITFAPSRLCKNNIWTVCKEFNLSIIFLKLLQQAEKQKKVFHTKLLCALASLREIFRLKLYLLGSLF